MEEAKPALPEDAKIAAKQKDWFVNDFINEFEWQEGEDGKPIAMKNGEVAKDSHGNAVTFDDLAKERISSSFVIPVVNGKDGNAGNKNQNGQGQNNNRGGGNLPKPKNFEELGKIMLDKNIKLEDRQSIKAKWDEEHGEKK